MGDDSKGSAGGRGRTGEAPAVERSAVISDCGLYRYELVRGWVEGGTLLFVCLNPSTADALQDDPTLRRCVGFARDLGMGRVVITNLFAFRATDPRDMKAAADPVGPENDGVLRALSAKADLTIAAWGAHGGYLGRDAAVLPLLRAPHYLALSKEGHPRHPLYLARSLRPRPM